MLNITKQYLYRSNPYEILRNRKILKINFDTLIKKSRTLVGSVEMLFRMFFRTVVEIFKSLSQFYIQHARW